MVMDCSFRIEWCDAFIKEADTAEVYQDEWNLEVGKKRLGEMIMLGKEDFGLPERCGKIPGGSVPELFFTPPPEPVLNRAHTFWSFRELSESGASDMMVFEKENLIVPLLGMDDHSHDAIRSWIT
jgi:hypothetical protein